MPSNSGNQKSCPLIYTFAYFGHFDDDRRSGLKGTSVNCQHVEKSGRATKTWKVRVISDAFHFKSDEPAFRVFRLGSYAKAFGRWGFLFSFSHSLIHTQPDTHLGHIQTL